MVCFVVVLQVVETNLVAFDCHWILINEVSATEMIYGSRKGCAFSSPYCFSYPGNIYGVRSRSPLISSLSWVFEGERRACFVSHPTTHKSWWPRTIYFSELQLLCTTFRNNKILYLFYAHHLFKVEPLYTNLFVRDNKGDLGGTPLDECVFRFKISITA